MKLAALLAFLILLAACGGPEPHAKTTPSAAAPIPAHATSVATAEWPDVYEATGAVRARSAATLSSKVMAYVQQVSVAVGDRVREGQTLVTLEARDLDAGVRRAEAARTEVQAAIPELDHSIAAAKANLDLAQSTFRRIEELASEKSVSNQELDEATTRWKATQSTHEAVRAKRAQLDARLAQVEQEILSATILRDYARIVAPFDGIVTGKSVDPGVLASPGAPLLTIERQGGYRLEVSVEESRLPSIHVGQSVAVTLDPDRAIQARVSEIVPAVDPASRTNLVKLDLPGGNLRSRAFGRATFPLAARKVLSVPVNALLERGQLQQVFVLEEGEARLRMVAAGRRANQAVEILSGLTDGEKVIAPIPAGLADGGRVEVRP